MWLGHPLTGRFFDHEKKIKKNKIKKTPKNYYVMRKKMFKNVIKIKNETNRTSRSKDRALLNLGKDPLTQPKKKFLNFFCQARGSFFLHFLTVCKKNLGPFRPIFLEICPKSDFYIEFVQNVCKLYIH